MSTVTRPATNGRIFADDPPPQILEVLEALVDADRGLFLDKRAYLKHSSSENAQQVIDSTRHLDEAMEVAERTLDNHFSYRPDAYWPVRGKLVGFSSVSKYGMRLRITAAWCDPRKRRTH